MKVEKRSRAVRQGRGMIRVRSIISGESTIAAVCPGCWNTPKRRRELIARLKQENLEPAHYNDYEDGVYKTQSHAPLCPYREDD